MSTLDQSYKAYSFANHKEVYLALEKCFVHFGIKYYLIGANARDVQLYKAGVKPNRGTADIDFAIMLPDIEKYNALRTYLLNNGFEQAWGNLPYRLMYSDSNTVIDLLPYGQIAQKHTVQFTERNMEISVTGLHEVALDAEIFTHPEGITIPVTPAHGLVILKLISWSENQERTKDLNDIKALLDAAWELYVDEVFNENSEYSDLFNDDFETHIVAARVMGRKMQNILNIDNNLKALIINELEKELDINKARKSQYIIAGTEQSMQDIQLIFNALLMGINDDNNAR